MTSRANSQSGRSEHGHAAPSIPTALGVSVLLVLLFAGGPVGCNRSKNKPAADSGETPTPAPGPVAPGAAPPGPNPPSNPPVPKFNFDVSKLGYDPARPEQTIAARQWPRRSSRGDTSLLGYNGK